VDAAPPAAEDEVRRVSLTGDVRGATTLAIQRFGPELLGFLHVLTGDPEAAGEVFADLCVRIWKGLPAFRWESSLRTWIYVLARRACHDHRRDRAAWQGRNTHLTDDAQLDALIVHLRTQGTTQLREGRAARIQRLRARLSVDEQTLLTLRVDRGLEWREIAIILSDADAPGDDELTRAAASLRKRYERVKQALRRMAAEDPDE
jgi:RNA polymerase sigma-70 factor (ECF subfamily)